MGIQQYWEKIPGYFSLGVEVFGGINPHFSSCNTSLAGRQPYPVFLISLVLLQLSYLDFELVYQETHHDYE